jgi:mycothiol synthase
MDLPAGLTTRPLEPSDARAVYEVMAAQELADIGRVEIEESDIVGDWARPSWDIATSSVGVFDGDRLVACAEVSSYGRGDAGVLPQWRGRGIGTALAHWMQDTARRMGMDVIGMPTPQGSPGDRLMEALGYHVRWTSWVLKLDAGATITERQLPAGYAVRAAVPAEHRALHTVLEDAFLEWSTRDRESFEDFSASVIDRPGMATWGLRVVTDPAGEVVGAAVVSATASEEGNAPEGYVGRIAIRRDERGKGLAQALLADSFEEARRHGAVTCSLSTDTRTGALGLYEKVGMRVADTWVNRGIALTG